MSQRNEPCTEPQTFARLFFHELDFSLLFHHFSRATGCQEAISSTLHVLSRESRDQYPSPYLPIPYFFVLSPLPPSRWPFTFKNQTQVHARSRANAPRFLPSCDKAKLLWNANGEIQLSDSMAIHGLENFRTHFSIDVSYLKEGEKKKKIKRMQEHLNTDQFFERE